MMKVLMSALLATAIQLSVTHAACAGENLAQIKSAGVFKVGTEGTFPPLPIMIPPASWWGLMSTSRVKLPAGLA
jgi:ABC-type amino acid transport substrate-binding protein